MQKQWIELPEVSHSEVMDVYAEELNSFSGRTESRVAFAFIMHRYRNSEPEEQTVIDMMLISLCGRSLSTLCKKALERGKEVSSEDRG